jgi:hypothetical protein
MKRKSCSTCWISGLSNDGLADDFEGFFRFMPVSELDKIPRNAGNYFGSVCEDGNVVFDPNSPDTRDVYPGLNRNDVPRLQALLLSSGNPGILVHFQSKPMAGTVHEVAVQAVARQDLPRCRVHTLAGGPISHCRDRSSLRFAHRFIPPPDTSRRPPHK